MGFSNAERFKAQFLQRLLPQAGEHGREVFRRVRGSVIKNQAV